MIDKMVIITGAGSGIGRALAERLADEECQVLAIGRRLESLQETQQHKPAFINILQADITVPADRERIADYMATMNKPLYLVHNAGLAEPLCLLKDITLEGWRQQQGVNLEAPLFLTQQLLPYLKQGRILHISSGLAHTYWLGTGAYCISKAALYMLYQCLREELTTFNIAVGSAIPGAVDTPMQDIIRSTSKDKLPTVDTFIRLKENGELLSPVIVADFLYWLLFKTNFHEFSAKEWDIDDSTHHSHWLKNSAIK